LAIDGERLKTWEQEADEVAAGLDTLAKTPTPRNYTLARNALLRFGDRFDRQMAINKEIPPYQIRVWKNRLETLQRLLDYGQRISFVNPAP
jgi:hypothetical protein